MDTGAESGQVLTPCPNCGHPEPDGRWCNWCGHPLASKAAEQLDPPPASQTVDSSALDARPRGAMLVALISAVAAATVVAQVMRPTAPPPQGTRTQLVGTVDLTDVTWLRDEPRNRPSDRVVDDGPFELEVGVDGTRLRISDLAVELDSNGVETARRGLPDLDQTARRLEVNGRQLLDVDPATGQVDVLVEVPLGWFILDPRIRAGRIMIARTDESGLAPFDNLASVDVATGLFLPFEAEAPRALVAGVIATDGARIALVREFDSVGLYIDVEREGISLGQIRLPTPESVVDASSVRIDAIDRLVAVTYRRRFPGRPIATTVHLRGPNVAWDADVAGVTAVDAVTLAVGPDTTTTVAVRRADNLVTSWVDGAEVWSVLGPLRRGQPPQMVGPAQGSVLVAPNDPESAWLLQPLDGAEATFTSLPSSDAVIAFEDAFVRGRRTFDGTDSSALVGPQPHGDADDISGGATEVGRADADHGMLWDRSDNQLVMRSFDGTRSDRSALPVSARPDLAAFRGATAIVPTATGLVRVDVGRGLRWTLDLPGITSPPVIVGDDVLVARGTALERIGLGDGAIVETGRGLFPATAWSLLPAGELLVVNGDGFLAGVAITVA